MKRIILILSLLVVFAPPAFSAGGEKVVNKIIAFSARIKGGEVELNWKVANPNNLYKFKLENKQSGTELYNPVTDVLFSNFRKKEENDSVSIFQYTYSDKPQENGVYFYRLNLVDIHNAIVAEEEIKIGITEVPEFKLHQNNPNPFNPSTVISYQLLVPANVKLTVYSLTGQYVDVLVDSYQTPGTYSINFNASQYTEMSSGIYFYKLETGYTTDIKKMIFTK